MNFRKSMSLILVLCMLLSIIPISAMAVENEDCIDTLTRDGANYMELHNQGFSRREIQIAFEREMIRLVNNHRATYDLPPLIFNAELSNIARLRAEESLYHNSFTHISEQTELQFTEHAREMGMNIGVAGENLSGNRQTPQEALNGWIASQGHRQFILSGCGNTTNYFCTPHDPLVNIGIGFDFNTNPVNEWNHTRFTLWQSNSLRLQNIIFDWNFHNNGNPQTIVNNAYFGLQPQTPDIPVRAGWSFLGWQPNLHPITQNNQRFVANWYQGQFDITWDFNMEWPIGSANNLIQITRNVLADTVPISPDAPPNSGFRFVAWYPDIHAITENTRFTALWELIENGCKL